MGVHRECLRVYRLLVDHCSPIRKHLDYWQTAVAGVCSERCGQVVTAARGAIPDQHCDNGFVKLFCQQYSFIEDSAICHRISLILASGVNDYEIAGRFDLIQNLLIKRGPVAKPIGNRRCAEAFTVERQNYFSSQTQRARFRQHDEIGSTSRGTNHSSKTESVKEKRTGQC